MKTALILACGAIVVAVGCGGDSTASQLELEQARHQGATAAHRSEAIRELRGEVAALKRQAKSSPTEPIPAQTSTAADAAGKADGRIPASGTYYGQAEQRGARASVNKDYPVNMTFSSSGSSVEYPTLECAGILRPLGFDGPDRLYEEEIESGHCDDGGLWRVYVEGASQLVATWSRPSSDYTVAAVLLR